MCFSLQLTVPPADQTDLCINLQSQIMGDLEAQSTKAQMAQPWSYQLFAVLMVLLLTMCATLTVFVAIKSSQNAQRISDLQTSYMDDIAEEVLRYLIEKINSCIWLG